jgi:hypothetical protein
MLRSRSISMLLAFVLLVPACPKPPASDDEGGSSSESESGGSGDAPWEAFAAAECQAYADCCMGTQGLAADVETCTQSRIATLATIAEAGTLSWDAACASARLDAIASTCMLGATECAATQCSLFVGEAAAGESCASLAGGAGYADAAECASGLACRSNACASPDCAPLACGAGGDACPPGSVCFCPLSGECGCAALGGEGDSCENFDVDPPCAPEFVCDVVCKQPAALGEPCNPEASQPPCVTDAYCDADTLVCMEKLAAGEACETGPQCLSTDCEAGTCADYGQAGDPCDLGDPSCDANLHCLLTDGGYACVTGRELGEACEAYNGQCPLGSYCVAGVCQVGLCLVL